MYAQVVSFQLKEGYADEFLAAVDAWKKNSGLRIAGCTQIITCLETEGQDRCTIVVLFNSQEALKEFGEDPDSLDAFDSAKRMMSGPIQFYEAKVDSATLE